MSDQEEAPTSSSSAPKVPYSLLFEKGKLKRSKCDEFQLEEFVNHPNHYAIIPLYVVSFVNKEMARKDRMIKAGRSGSDSRKNGGDTADAEIDCANDAEI